MATEIVVEHNDDDEKNNNIRRKSHMRIRILLIVLNSILAAYLAFFVGKSIYDHVKDVDDDLVTLCDMSASKSKERYASLVDETYDINDYFVYGNYLHLSQDRFDARTYTPLTNLQLVYVTKNNKDSETVVPIKDCSKYMNEGIDLSSLDQGDYIIKKNNKAIKVLSGPNKQENVIYTLPAKDSQRKQITIYSYPKNPCLVIKVQEINELPSDVYDFVLVGAESVTNSVSSVFNEGNYKVAYLNDDTSLKDVDSYKSSFVIKLEIQDEISSGHTYNSTFVNSSFSSIIDETGLTKGLDQFYFIRELGGRQIGGNQRNQLIPYSGALASIRGDYDSGKMAFIIQTPKIGVSLKCSEIIDFVQTRRGLI